MSNPYWDNVCAIAERQRAKGIATYGQGIEKNQADIIKRIEHLEEELVDALMYCEWIKDGIKNSVSVVRCKECISYEARPNCQCGYCWHWEYETGESPNTVDGDDYCSYGVRRD